jgi:hypothetical protein
MRRKVRADGSRDGESERTEPSGKSATTATSQPSVPRRVRTQPSGQLDVCRSSLTRLRARLLELIFVRHRGRPRGKIDAPARRELRAVRPLPPAWPSPTSRLSAPAAPISDCGGPVRAGSRILSAPKSRLICLTYIYLSASRGAASSSVSPSEPPPHAHACSQRTVEKHARVLRHERKTTYHDQRATGLSARVVRGARERETVRDGGCESPEADPSKLAAEPTPLRRRVCFRAPPGMRSDKAETKVSPSPAKPA